MLSLQTLLDGRPV